MDTVRATGNVVNRMVRKRKRRRNPVAAVSARNAISVEAITTLPAKRRLLAK